MILPCKEGDHARKPRASSSPNAMTLEDPETALRSLAAPTLVVRTRASASSWVASVHIFALSDHGKAGRLRASGSNSIGVSLPRPR